MSSPSEDSVDNGSGDSMDFPSVHIPTSSNSSVDNNDDDNYDDDATSISSNRMYSNSDLSYPQNKDQHGTISAGQKVGYSILLLVSCALAIASGLIVYRQQQRTQQQRWAKSIKDNFSWIKWGMQIQFDNNNTSNTMTATTPLKNSILKTATKSKRRKHKNRSAIQVTSSSSSTAESSEQEQLTRKFRNEI
jgi:hypothetical protein